MNITLAMTIISALIPLVKAGSEAYANITEARAAIERARAEGRQLTAKEFADFMGRNYAPGLALEQLGDQAAAELAAVPAAPAAPVPPIPELTAPPPATPPA